MVTRGGSAGGGWFGGVISEYEYLLLYRPSAVHSLEWMCYGMIRVSTVPGKRLIIRLRGGAVLFARNVLGLKYLKYSNGMIGKTYVLYTKSITNSTRGLGCINIGTLLGSNNGRSNTTPCFTRRCT